MTPEGGVLTDWVLKETDRKRVEVTSSPPPSVSNPMVRTGDDEDGGDDDVEPEPKGEKDRDAEAGDRHTQGRRHHSCDKIWMRGGGLAPQPWQSGPAPPPPPAWPVVS